MGMEMENRAPAIISFAKGAKLQLVFPHGEPVWKAYPNGRPKEWQGRLMRKRNPDTLGKRLVRGYCHMSLPKISEKADRLAHRIDNFGRAEPRREWRQRVQSRREDPGEGTR